MKKILFVALLVMTATIIVGCGNSSTNNDLEATCSFASNLAQKVMDSRQAGDAMADVLDAAVYSQEQKAETPSQKAMLKLAEKIVVKAWEFPQYNDSEERKQVVREFRDAIESKCHKSKELTLEQLKSQ